MIKKIMGMKVKLHKFVHTLNYITMSNSSSNSSGIGLFGLLGVAFIVLKLCNVITWSWWIVTLPIWGGLALGIVILIVGIIGELISNK